MEEHIGQQQVAGWRCCNCAGLLAKLCDVLMASGVPADVLTETINTVAEVIRGNQYNQEYFASVMAPSTPPRCVCAAILCIFISKFCEVVKFSHFLRPEFNCL